MIDGRFWKTSQVNYVLFVNWLQGRKIFHENACVIIARAFSEEFQYVFIRSQYISIGISLIPNPAHDW